MNRITASLSALGTAAVITAGGLFFAPNGAPASTGTPPGTKVPVELIESGGPLRDGEVTTTIYSVVQRNGRATAGNSVQTSTRASFDASLPDGEYLIKTVVGQPTELFHVDDIDSTSPVPAGANCGDRTDCTWIVVNNGRWSLKVGGTQTHSTATFQFARRAPAPTTTVPQTPPPTTTPADQVGQSAAPQQMQTVTLELADETDGLRPDMPRIAGAVTLVHYTPDGSSATFVNAAVTGPDGAATHVIPVGTYTVQLVAPAPYTLTRVAPAGPHGPHGDVEELHLYLAVRPTGSPTPSGASVTSGDEVDTPAVTPATPAVSPATPATPQPEPSPESQPEPQPEPQPTPEPSPEPQPTPEPQPEPQPTPEPQPEPQPEPSASMGCDTSADPEIHALLRMNDGAIRWLVDGELMTLWPEPGMEPVRVCVDAYHRLTELGVDIDYYTAY